ncbi:hypothetical protein HanXRQr2_Chr13g0585341 [Helianthus annuus]|uniref:Uncharacterized protein n=1 Tax=Helianthus annuus TaxID=4232 RepID=A0A9K3HAP4_HELAN|nr:hypothetical protein HanXRQr2_Chr13g0585341 [Helianthus annuus]KAJ0480953.1 hypothetical protein HanIR_Chr13g0637351 [Helianthus annuus]KAJ0497485.1 hypothetical protein HanHA89_Chr13g0511891 [Helianthus annuus]KAJ0663502.1 hypothetical protein HanLR1_Chr13g0481911 [Helianthus annuus]KAJ0670997.1 hypothetical protein HanOQP8_Chr13g0480791 [Helianthus annuus]
MVLINHLFNHHYCHLPSSSLSSEYEVRPKKVAKRKKRKWRMNRCWWYCFGGGVLTM